ECGGNRLVRTVAQVPTPGIALRLAIAIGRAVGPAVGVRFAFAIALGEALHLPLDEMRAELGLDGDMLFAIATDLTGEEFPGQDLRVRAGEPAEDRPDFGVGQDR